MGTERKYIGAADLLFDAETGELIVKESGGLGITQVPVPVAQGAPGDLVITGAEAGKTVCMHEVNLSLDVAGTIVLKDSDGTAFGTWNVAATGRLILSPILVRIAGRCLAAGKGLTLTTTLGAAKGFITYSKA